MLYNSAVTKMYHIAENVAMNEYTTNVLPKYDNDKKCAMNKDNTRCNKMEKC